MAARSERLKESSFVMRLWLEATVRGCPEWRWHVQHVQSGEQRYFRRLDDVLEFVAERAGVPPPGGSSKTQGKLGPE